MEPTMLRASDLMMSLLLISSSLAGQSATAILGKWKGEEEPGRQLLFYQEKNGTFSGKVIQEDLTKSNTAVFLFKSLVYDEQTHSYKGQMTPPHAKLSINATITFIHEDRLEIVGKKRLLTRTFHLIRSR